MKDIPFSSDNFSKIGANLDGVGAQTRDLGLRLLDNEDRVKPDDGDVAALLKTPLLATRDAQDEFTRKWEAYIEKRDRENRRSAMVATVIAIAGVIIGIISLLTK